MSTNLKSKLKNANRQATSPLLRKTLRKASFAECTRSKNTRSNSKLFEVKRLRQKRWTSIQALLRIQSMFAFAITKTFVSSMERVVMGYRTASGSKRIQTASRHQTTLRRTSKSLGASIKKLIDRQQEHLMGLRKKSSPSETQQTNRPNQRSGYLPSMIPII